MTETPPDADEIERARNLVEIEGMAVGFDRNHTYWKLFFAAETLLRALDTATAERDALRAEAEWYRRAINDALGDLESGHAMQCRDTLRAALNPQPDAEEDES